MGAVSLRDAVGDEAVTWTEWAVILLIGERGFRIAWEACAGALAAYRAMTAKPAPPLPPVGGLAPGPYPFWRSRDDGSVEHAALDYSSGSKRH